MFEHEVEGMAQQLRAEADIDFFDISLIAEPLRERLGLQSQDDIRHHTLRVIERLIALGVKPGDYDYATTISFWPGTPAELLDRIETEWVALGRTPDLGESICWFSLHP